MSSSTKSVLLLACLLAAPSSASASDGASQATGTIAGVVTNAATTLPVAGISVYFYDSTGGYEGQATTSAQGLYVSPPLESGLYLVRTSLADTLGLIDEVFDNIPCFRGTCSQTLGTPVSVTAPAQTANVNFALSPAGRISGTVTNSATTLPVSGVNVTFYDSGGSSIASSQTNAEGIYISPALLTGLYFVRTYVPYGSGLVDEFYDNIPCPPTSCYPTNASPVAVTVPATTANIDFALSPGGRISGTVTRAADALPLANVSVEFTTLGGSMAGIVSTNAQGSYTSPALAPGSYYVKTSSQAALGVIDEVYNDVPCWSYCSVTSGTPVAVASAATTANIDFVLSNGGRISGTVTNASTTLPVANASVEIYTSTGSHVAWATADAQGVYTSPALPTGTYFVRTSVSYSTGLIDELFDDISCLNWNCQVLSGTPVAVTAPATTANVNFALTPAARITGTVTNAGTGQPVPNVYVEFYLTTGSYQGSAMTDAQGVYLSRGLPAGSYVVRTSSPDQAGVIDELFDNIPCFRGHCSLTAGTPVSVALATTATVNFALSPGARISGTVTNAASGLPVPNVAVYFYNGVGQQVGSSYTDAQGDYTSPGLATGSYFVRTSAGSYLGLTNELFDNIPCPGWTCPVTTGTPVAVTAPNTVGNIDFALAPGGRIEGKVIDATTGLPVPNATVSFYTSAGAEAGDSLTDSQGVYSSPPLPSGSYRVLAEAPEGISLISEMFDNVPCPGGGCSPGAGTPVVVTAPGTTPNIHFALSPGGRISGTVTNATTGLPVENVTVLFYNTSGSYVASASTDAAGRYTSLGLPAGSYVARTSAPSASGLIDQLFDGVPCVGGTCPVTSGTSIVVAVSETSANIDFALQPGGRISGTVTSASSGGPLQVTVFFYTSSGFATFSLSDENGAYSSPGLPAGTYYVRTSALPDSGLVDELFDNIPCPGGSCVVTNGSPIVVTVAATTGNIDFALSTGGRISGNIRNATTMWHVPNVWVEFYSAGGAYVTSALADTYGHYSSPGLPAGSYFVRTAFASSQDLVDELYDNVPCFAGACVVTTGTAVIVTPPATTTNIDFALTPLVSSAPIVTTHPVSRTAVAGSVASFSAAAVGALPLWVQWQASADGGSTWSDIPGASSLTYAFVVALSDNGRQFRAVFTNSHGFAFTAAAVLTARGPARAGDFDGDNLSEIGLWRPSSGSWFVRLSSTGFNSYWLFALGAGGDVPVPADYDGDGRNDVAVWRPSTGQWLIRLSTTGYAYMWVYAWGTTGDIPVPADYDGDGRAEIAVYRPSTGAWFMRLSSTSYASSAIYSWGTAGDVPVRGDFDGDGRAEIAVWRPSTGQWFMRLSASGYAASAVHGWGTAGDVPLPADFDGDSIADIAIWRPSTAQWFILESSTGYATSQVHIWGAATDQPVPIDIDGDGRAEIGVWRPSTGQWFMRLSSTNYLSSAVYAWGTTGDVPINGY